MQSRAAGSDAYFAAKVEKSKFILWGK